MAPVRPAELYLASRSPRRRELLTQLGVRFHTLEVDVDETRRPGEPPERFVRRLAEDKARRGGETTGLDPGLPVLGADTVVLLGDEALGKPRDADHALGLLARLSGRCHEVLTAVALAGPCTGGRLSRSRVCFRTLSEEECRAYCATGEPLDKAGAYAIQGLAASFVTRLEGSYSGVVGLPLYETAELLRDCGIDLLADRRTRS